MMSVEDYLALDRRATENLWTLHIFGPGDIVELSTLTISFPISSLYEDVTLPGNDSDDPECPT